MAISSVTIQTLEPNGITTDRTPRISWTYADSDGHVQIAYKVTLKTAAAEVIFAQTEFTSGNLFWDVPLELATGDYVVYLQLKCSGGVYSSETSMAFSVVNAYENILRWVRNNATASTEDEGFEDWYSITDLDTTTNPERVSLGGVNLYQTGTLTIRHNAKFSGVVWGAMIFDATCNSDSSVVIKVRAADSIAALDVATYSASVISGYGTGVVGQYLDIQITLTPSSDGSVSPALHMITLTYQIPPSGGEQSQVWKDFTTVPDTSNSIEISNGDLILAAEQITRVYTSEGYITFRHDAGTLVDWLTCGWEGNVPTGCTLEFYFRTYNKLADREAASWSLPTSYSTGNSGTITLGFSKLRFLEMKVRMVSPTSGHGSTPTVTKFTLSWLKTYFPRSRYLYTANFTFPSNLSKILLTANHDAPDGCEVEYGITCINSVNFEKEGDYQIIPLNNLVDNIATPGKSVRICAKLTSGDLTNIPVVHELAFQLETDDNDILYLQP